MTQNKKIPQFKVWDNDRKEWARQSLILNSWFRGGKPIEVFYILATFRNASTINEVDKFEVKKIENPTICRFTGLFDKNGLIDKPAYQNDIVKILDNRLADYEQDIKYLIEFEAKGHYFILRALGLKYDSPKYDIRIVDCDINFIILGNRFDNPELLGQHE